MRNFSKKLAFVLAAAMVFTAFAPAAKADAAEKEMAMNRASQTLYVNEDGVNQKGAETLPEGLYGNVQEYDFYVKNKPANYAKEYNFKWESSKPEVATVDNKGLTKAVAVGTTTITCTITDKATGDPVTEVSAKVTVKANAAAVVITNADEYEDFVVADERVIDLNRKMYAEGDKEGTSKRGVKVTDYTKWVAKFDGEVVDATVVAIDQATGKFTFAADAPAGEYELSCYTYQSDKYNQATATSDSVVVTVKEAVELAVEDVDQKSLTVFTVNFTAPVKSLAKADVTVKKVLKNGFEMTSQVKTVALAKDGMSADVTMFGNLADATTYKITVTGMKTYDKLMSAGAPAYVEVFVGKADNFLVEITDTKCALDCKLYDINYVDVTTETLKSKVNYTLEKYATDGSYYLSGKNLIIKKENSDPVVVKATYRRNTVNGKVETAEGYGEFYGYKKEAAYVNAYAVTVNNKFDAPSLKFQKSQTPTLMLQVVDTDNNKITMENGTIGSYGSVTFEALNPEIAVINGTTVTLKAFQTGLASFLVYVDADGTGTKASPEPVYEFTLEVEADSAYASADISTNFVTVSGADEFDTADFIVSAVDQYGQPSELTVADVAIEGLTDLAKGVKVSDVFTMVAKDKKVTITIDGSEARKAFKDPALKGGESGALDFKLKVKNKDEFTFTVNVQVPGESAGNYISISAKESINATRMNEKDMTDAKSVTFEVIEMNCEVKVKEVEGLTVLPEKDADKDTYYYKLLKDGKAVPAAVSGNKISFALTGTKTVSGGAIDGNALVSYENTGAGVYTFELYKGADQIASKTTIVDVDAAGTYNVSGDMKAESVKKGTYTKADLLACFTISDRKGNDVLKKDATPLYADYDVDVDVADDYVFVKKITFYEKVVDGVYVSYAVDINEVLKLTNN